MRGYVNGGADDEDNCTVYVYNMPTHAPPRAHGDNVTGN